MPTVEEVSGAAILNLVAKIVGLGNLHDDELGQWSST